MKKNPSTYFGFYFATWHNDQDGFNPFILYFHSNKKDLYILYPEQLKRIPQKKDLKLFITSINLKIYNIMPISSRQSINFLKEKIKTIDPKGYKLLG